MCHQFIGDLDVEKRTRHIVFCTKLHSGTCAEATTSTSSSKKETIAPKDNAGKGETDSKKPAASRKISRNKLEQEFFKFSIDEQRKILDHLNSTLKSDRLECEPEAKSSSSKPAIAQCTASNKFESDLFNLRMELGDIINSEAELRLREKRVRTNIKKLTRKVSLIDDPAPMLGQFVSEDSILNALFPTARYTAIDNASSSSNRSASKCLLWQLSSLSDLFDEDINVRVLNEERDAVIPTAAVAVSMMSADKVIDWSNVGSTCVVQPATDSIPCTEARIELSEAVNDVIDLTLRSESASCSNVVGPTDPISSASSDIAKNNSPRASLFSQVVNSSAKLGTPLPLTAGSPNVIRPKSRSAAVSELLSHSVSNTESFDGMNTPSFDAIVSTAIGAADCDSEALEVIRRWYSNLIESLPATSGDVSEAFSCLQKLQSVQLRVISSQDVFGSPEGRLILHLLVVLIQYVTSSWQNDAIAASPTELMEQTLDSSGTFLSQGGFMMSQEVAEVMEEAVGSGGDVSRSGTKRPREDELATPPISQDEHIVNLMSEVHPNSNVKRSSTESDNQAAKRTDVEMMVEIAESAFTPPCTQLSHGHDQGNPIELITPSPAVTVFIVADATAATAEALGDVAVDLTQLSAEDAPVAEKPQDSNIFSWDQEYFIYDQDFTTYDTVSDVDGGVASHSVVASTDTSPTTSVAAAAASPVDAGAALVQTDSAVKSKPVPNNENSALNHQHVPNASPALNRAVRPSEITDEMSLDEALSAFIQGSSFYDDILSYRPINIDRVKYEFATQTNRRITDSDLLRYLDKEGAFVSGQRGNFEAHV